MAVHELPAALAQLPALAGAAQVERLTNGPVSDKWLVQSAAGKVVVRRDRPLAARLGLDRDRELACLVQLARSGWQPPPLHAEPATGLLVVPYIEGRSWTTADYRDQVQLQRLGALLAALHALSAELPPVDFASAIRNYANTIATDDAAQCARQALELLAAVEPKRLCICHNDPTDGNLVDGPGGLRLIDWEYAGAGDPAMDLAVVIEHHALRGGEIAGLLRAYRQAGGSADESALEQWRCIYQVTARLWALAVAG